MYQTPEQIIAMNKANLEATMRFAGVAIEGAERMIDLQMKAAKSAFADSIQSAKALAAVKDFQELAALMQKYVDEGRSYLVSDNVARKYENVPLLSFFC